VQLQLYLVLKVIRAYLEQERKERKDPRGFHQLSKDPRADKVFRDIKEKKVHRVTLQ
jgi:hypothetical protein